MNDKKPVFWQWQDTAIVVLGLAVIAFTLIHYKQLPDQLPMHFDVHDNVDGYGKKLNVIGFLSCLGLFLPIALGTVRRIDPRKSNYERFLNAFGMIRLVLAVFLDFILVAVVLYGLGHKINVTHYVTVGVGLIFMITGNYLPQVKDNFFVGIRTPWTLNNPEVWRRTHRLGGRLWVATGFLLVLSVLLPVPWRLPLLLIALIPLVFVPTVYSWWISRSPQ
jgi:uncharacterized membrane protein